LREEFKETKEVTRIR